MLNGDHSAILSTSIKLPFSIKTFVLSNFKWPIKTGFTVCMCSAQSENLDNSGITLRKVRIPKLADRVRILTWRGTIPELSVRKVRIGTK